MIRWGRRPYMPPRKKDWTPGTHQVGVFVRTPKGTVIEVVHDNASESEAGRVLAAVCGEDIAKIATGGSR